MTKEDIRCQRSLEHLAMLRDTGGIRNPGLRQLWRIGTSPLACGRHAEKAQAMLSRIITPMFLAQQFMPPKPPRIPAVPPECAILMGFEVSSRRPILIHRDKLAHTLLIGAPSMGKSRLVYSIIAQLMRQNMRARA